MIGIVLISHSEKIVEGIRELALQMAPNANVAIAGGTDDNRIGTNVDKIMSAIERVNGEEGVLVFYDIGSAFMNAELALELLNDEKVELIDASIVEGAMVAIIESTMGRTKEEIKQSLQHLLIPKRI